MGSVLKTKMEECITYHSKEHIQVTRRKAQRAYPGYKDDATKKGKKKIRARIFGRCQSTENGKAKRYRIQMLFISTMSRNVVL